MTQTTGLFFTDLVAGKSEIKMLSRLSPWGADGCLLSMSFLRGGESESESESTNMHALALISSYQSSDPIMALPPS